jgi:recombination protein RecT
MPIGSSGKAPANRPAKTVATKADPANTLELVEAKQWAQFLATYEQSFASIAPEHVSVDAFVALAAAYVRRDAKLQEAVTLNPGSLILALRECAALGHVPMKGMFSLVPYNDKNAPGGKRVVGIEEYRGVVERMYRAGGIQSVHVEVVREADHCRFQRTRMVLPDHTYDEFADDIERGPLKAVYAWARMRDGGTSDVAWLPKGQVLKHRQSSRSGDAFWGPAWPDEGPWTPDMWKKTALHVLERLVPTSSSYRVEVIRSEAAAAASERMAGMPDRSPRQQPYDVIQDAELVDDGADAQPSDGEPQRDGESWPKVADVPSTGGAQ